MPTIERVRKERAKQFHWYRRKLLRDWPGSIPVNVRWIQTAATEVYGRCRFIGRERARIMVYGTNWRAAVDTLIHEWAHYLVGEDSIDAKTGSAHSDEWGRKYAELWRWYEDVE